LVVSILLIHIVPPVFLLFWLIITFVISILRKQKNWSFVARKIGEVIIGGVFSIIILWLFNRSLLIGIIQEIDRKGIAPTSSSESTNIFTIIGNNLMNQFSGIFFGLDLIIIPLAIVGIFLTNKWRKNASFVNIVITAATFIFIPAVSFPRAIYFCIIPLVLLTSEGLIYLIRTISRFQKTPCYNQKTQVLGIFIVFLFIVPVFVSQTYIAANPGPYREYSEFDENINHPLGLAAWIDENITNDAVIAFPNSGALGRIIEILVENQIYFADRRYSDVPVYIDIANIYDSGNRNWSNRISIIQQYNLSIIITGFSYQISNISSLQVEYPSLEIIPLFSRYNFIILYPDLVLSGSYLEEVNFTMH